MRNSYVITTSKRMDFIFKNGAFYPPTRWDRVKNWFRKTFRRKRSITTVVGYDPQNKSFTVDTLPSGAESGQPWYLK